MNVEASHPKTHMMTNIYVDEQDENVIMNFRIVALLGKGLVGTASYYDRVVKTDEGWRVQHRECMIHRRDKRDAPCDENN